MSFKFPVTVEIIIIIKKKRWLSFRGNVFPFYVILQLKLQNAAAMFSTDLNFSN